MRVWLGIPLLIVAYGCAKLGMKKTAVAVRGIARAAAGVRRRA